MYSKGSTLWWGGGGGWRVWVMYVHAWNIRRLRVERPNWLPDLISLGEDEHKHLDHQQLVLSSKGVRSLRRHAQEGRSWEHASLFLVTQPVTEAEEVAMEDEAGGKRPAVSSTRSLLVKDTYPVIAELELQGKTFLVCCRTDKKRPLNWSHLTITGVRWGKVKNPFLSSSMICQFFGWISRIPLLCKNRMQSISPSRSLILSRRRFSPPSNLATAAGGGKI